MKRILFKHILPLILAFLGAVVFFVSYNHYLLDKSLANMKISIKRLGRVENLEEAKKIKDILDDTFIMEAASKDLDPADLAKIEFSGEIIEKLSYRKQIKDAEHFIGDVVKERKKETPVILSLIEDMVVNAAPYRRKEDPEYLRGRIEEIEKDLSLYKGEELQKRYLEIGRLYLRLKDWNSAFNDFNMAIEIDPQTPLAGKARLYLGLIYKRRRDYDDAIDIFTKPQKGLSKDLIYFYTYQAGDSLSRIGKTEESIKVFEDLFEKDVYYGVNQVSQFRVGYTYLYDIEDDEKAYLAFKKLQELAPESSVSNYLEYKIIPEMSHKYREIGYRYLREAYRFLKEGRYKEALDEFNLAVKFNPKDALSYSGKGLTFYFLEREEESIEEASRAEEISPRHLDIIENLGYIYYNVGELKDAIKEYEKAVKLHPDSYVSHYNLGTLYILAGKSHKGIYHLKKSIGLSPDFAYPYNNLGYVLWYRKRHEEAMVLLKKAISLKPDYVDAHYNLAVALYNMGDHVNARKEFMRAKELQPNYKETEPYLKKIKESIRY